MVHERHNSVENTKPENREEIEVRLTGMHSNGAHFEETAAGWF